MLLNSNYGKLTLLLQCTAITVLLLHEMRYNFLKMISLLNPYFSATFPGGRGEEEVRTGGSRFYIPKKHIVKLFLCCCYKSLIL